jgi:hypothetical protein
MLTLCGFAVSNYSSALGRGVRAIMRLSRFDPFAAGANPR